VEWTPQGHRNGERTKKLEKEIWRKKCEQQVSGLRYSWRKIEAATKDRAGWKQVVCGLCATGSVKD